MKKLGYLTNHVYYLTDEGKKVIINEVNNRIYNSTKNIFYDYDFENLIRYIVSNYDVRLDIAVCHNVKKIDSAYTKYSKISRNKRSLELWFEANNSESNLTGKDIINYFLSDDYSYIVEEFNQSYTIRELTSILNSSVTLQSKKTK